MKPLFTKVTLAIACVASTAWLFTQQNSALANPESSLTPAQSQRLSRDLTPSRSQDFFRDGQQRLEREIVILLQRQRRDREPVLFIRNEELNELPQAEIETSPTSPTNQQLQLRY